MVTDLRFARRRLLNSPGFALLALLSLGRFVGGMGRRPSVHPGVVLRAE